MRTIIALSVLVTLALPVDACFGPKLYLGAGSGPEGDLLYALVSLYIKEKTGTETIRVSLEGLDPVEELRTERLDLAFIPTGTPFRPVFLAIPGWSRLAAGRRPLEDLQFTTLSPALGKLDRLLKEEHLRQLQAAVRAGEPPAAAVRRFLVAQGWI